MYSCMWSIGTSNDVKVMKRVEIKNNFTNAECYYALFYSGFRIPDSIFLVSHSCVPRTLLLLTENILYTLIDPEMLWDREISSKFFVNVSNLCAHILVSSALNGNLFGFSHTCVSYACPSLSSEYFWQASNSKITNNNKYMYIACIRFVPKLIIVRYSHMEFSSPWRAWCINNWFWLSRHT